MEKIYLTKEGFEKLSKELDFLKNTKRKEIAAALNHARSLGDLRENAEYDAAKEALAINERRILETEDKLARTEIITQNDCANRDTAYLGSKVKMRDLDTDEVVEYFLVGQEEADPINGKISIASPVGKQLLGKKAGDTVDIDVPAGILKYNVLFVS